MTARLMLRLLGSFEARLDDKPLTGFDSDKSRALLAYLAVESHRAHRREVLCNLLWPNVAESSARQSLSQALSNLRRLLGDPVRDTARDTARDTVRVEPETTPPYLLTSRETIQFNPKSSYSLDVAEVQAAADQDSLPRLLTLPTSAFLEGFTLADAETFEEWQLLYRENLQRILIEALARLAQQHMGPGQREWAIRAAQRQLELDPWREEAHRQLMQAYALEGQRSSALTQYEKCKAVLRQMLNVEPSAETQTLLARIRSGEFDAPATPAPETTPNALNTSSTPSTSTSAARPRTTPARPAPARPAPTTLLPTALTPFVGRERELGELAELLAQPTVRLITLTGLGGMGKSRLAIEAASHATQQFVDGAAYVPLASLTTADLIVPAIAAALNVSVTAVGDPVSQLAHQLQGRRLLVILDGLEHLLPACAEIVSQLVNGVEHTTWLVTSREVLQLSGEWVYEVQGLGDAAERLFLQTARRARNDLPLGAAEQATVARICRRLGGTPLAIELAAAWVRMLSLDEIADEIDRDLDILAAQARDMPERHRSMRAVFDHSWKLLSDADQRILERLAVFRGGFTRESARQVAGASLAALSAFISKSFIRRTRESRFDLHELVRQYALQRFEAGSPAALQQAYATHAQYFLQLARTAADALNGPSQITWLNQLEDEHDNLRAALGWACEAAAAGVNADAVQPPLLTATQLADALGQFWFIHGHHREGRRWLAQVIGLVDHQYPEYRALAPMPDDASANTSAQDAPLDQLQAYASALRWHGFLTFLQGDLHTARQDLERSVALSRRNRDKLTQAAALHFLGMVESAQGNWDEAQRLQEQSAQLGDELGMPLIHALAMGELGTCALALKDWATAETRYREAAALFTRINDHNQLASPMRMLGYLALKRGDAPQARVYFIESLRLNLEVGDPRGQAACLMGLANVAHAEGDDVLSAQLFGAANSVLKAVADSLMPGDQQLLEPYLAALAEAMTRPEIEQAYAEGRAMPAEAAIQRALSYGTTSMA